MALPPRQEPAREIRRLSASPYPEHPRTASLTARRLPPCGAAADS